MPLRHKLVAKATEEKIVETTARYLALNIKSVLRRQRTCLIGLCGSEAWLSVFRTLTSSTQVNWSKVYVFLTDEPHTMTDQSEPLQSKVRDILAAANHPEINFLAPDTSKDPTTCAYEYGERLETLLQRPDIVCLGLGKGGSVAGLRSPVPIEALDKDFIALHTTEGEDDPGSITVTLSFLQAASTCMFMLESAKKLHLWNDMMTDKSPVQERLRKHPALSLINGHDVLVVSA